MAKKQQDVDLTDTETSRTIIVRLSLDTHEALRIRVAEDFVAAYGINNDGTTNCPADGQPTTYDNGVLVYGVTKK